MLDAARDMQCWKNWVPPEEGHAFGVSDAALEYGRGEGDFGFEFGFSLWVEGFGLAMDVGWVFGDPSGGEDVPALPGRGNAFNFGSEDGGEEA